MSQVSIIIPVYNAGLFLRETLDSISNQTFSDWECVIVNDGSTDNSLSIIEEYIKKDNRFVCYSISNSGCADIPRNYGVVRAQSDYVLNLDADDIIKEDYLNQSIQRLVTTKADIVIGQLIGYISNLDGEIYRIPLQSFDKSQIITGKYALTMTISGWLFSTAGMLVNK